MEFKERLRNALRHFSIVGFSLQLQQEQNFSVKLFKGGDTLAVLPTGFGKSLIFSILFFFFFGKSLCSPCDLSIVNDQIKEATSMGMLAGL